MAPTGARRVTVAIQGSEKEQVTVLGVVCADGRTVSPMLILKYQNAIPETIAQAASEITQGTGKFN